ncbi:MAG: hypothetical protein ACJ71H_01175 [Nitrososphaeraceae archaeon]
MSQNPEKRNKDSKEVAENNIEQPIDNEDPTTESVEEVAGQRDTADSADSMIV